MMGITLRSLLETDFFAKTKVLAGKKGLDKEVSSVTVIDAPEGVKWLKGGELALTTAYSIKDDVDKQVQLIEELAKTNSSGLGIKLRYLNDRIPEEMKRKADQLGFTIFQVDESYAWVDVITFVMFRAVVHRSKNINMDGESYSLFLDKVYKEEGFAGVVDVLEYHTGLNAAIIYKDRIYQGSSDYFREDKILDKKNWVLKEARSDYFNIMDKNLYLYEMETEDEKLEWVSLDILYNYKIVGYVLLSSKERPLKEKDIVLLEQASMAAEAEIQRINLSSTIRLKHREQFLKDLMNNEIDDYDEAYFKCRELGWNLHRNNHVLLVKIMDNTKMDSINSQISSKFDNLICGIYGNLSLIFILPPNDKGIHALVEEIKFNLEELLENDFQIGLGSLVEFNELNRSYHQAEKVIKVVSKSPFLEGVYDYKDIGFFRLIDIEDSYQDVAKYVDDYLGPLLYSEKENKEELLETLSLFFDSGCNVKDTSEKMYMHPNSIRYRIEVIEEIYGIDLNTCKDRVNLAIALKLLPFLE